MRVNFKRVGEIDEDTVDDQVLNEKELIRPIWYYQTNCRNLIGFLKFQKVLACLNWKSSLIRKRN